MLCSRPTRAHPPIVDVVKWTLAAARISCASESVIQSAADGIVQSEVLIGAFDGAPDFDGLAASVEASPSLAAVDADDVAASDDEPEALVDALLSEPRSEPRSDESSSLRPDEAPDLTVALRSFFAQPEPL